MSNLPAIRNKAVQAKNDVEFLGEMCCRLFQEPQRVNAAQKNRLVQAVSGLMEFVDDLLLPSEVALVKEREEKSDG